MKEYLDEDYASFLENKTVALVGPASYLTKLEIGDLINSYDIVVRVNRGLELIKDYEKNLGSRTDILYNCGIKSPDNGGSLDCEFYKQKGVKWISTIPHSDYNGKCTANNLNPMVDEKFIKQSRKDFSFHLMDWHLYSDLNKKVKCRSNTGFAAIFDLLNHNPKSLLICGYSFYLDSFAKGYKKGCKWSEEKFSKECFVSKRHIQPNQWKVLKDFYEEDERIHTDSVLEKILQMESLRREQFKKIIHSN